MTAATDVAAGSETPRDRARRWAKIASSYAEASPRRSVTQVLATVLPLAATWAAMALFFDVGYWVTLLLAVPAAAFMVRLFLIQHDCGHRSFFRSPRLNDLLGNVIGVLTLTPHAYWRQAHNIHHATSGNLDKRGIGDLRILTVREYLTLPRWKRIAYRFYRNPFVFLGIGPIYVFGLKFRLPLDLLREHRGLIGGVMATNIAIVLAIVGLGFWLGFAKVLLIQAPIVFMSSMAGVFLFYVQHQFEQAYWRDDRDWDFFDSAILGSTFFDLPRPLRWLTANIGLHHIHHLSFRIPNYRLNECLRDHPEMREVNRITLRSSLKCLRLALWDEEAKRLIPFRALKQPQFALAGS